MGDVAPADAVDIALASQLLTYDEMRNALTQLAEMRQEWAGIPLPVEGYKLTIAEGYPYEGLADVTEDDTKQEDVSLPEDIVAVNVRNRWFSRQKHGVVVLVDILHADGHVEYKHFIDYQKNHAPARLTLTLDTINVVATVHDPKTEMRAMGTLREHISAHQFKMYFLTGMFMEQSKRSQVYYLFRRGLPTVALGQGRRDKALYPLCALCLHPVAYYQNTHAGGMVPTDDVIAHLLLMRGDEHMLWKRSSQHHPESPEAGI